MSPFSVLRSPFSLILVVLVSCTNLFAQNPGNGAITITSATYSQATNNITIVGTMSVDVGYSATLDSIVSELNKNNIVTATAGTVGVNWFYTPDSNPPPGKLSGTWTKVIALTSGTWSVKAKMQYASANMTYTVNSSAVSVTVP